MHTEQSGSTGVYINLKEKQMNIEKIKLEQNSIVVIRDRTAKQSNYQ